MGENLEKSGIDVAANDSGWPVGNPEFEPPHTKDGTGADPFPKAKETTQGVVIDGGKDEVQKVTLSNATGGSFKLTFDGEQTAAIAYNATGATVQKALEALDNVESGDVEVSGGGGGPHTITFGGQYVDTNVPTITVDKSGLTGEGADVTVTTTQAGSPL